MNFAKELLSIVLFCVATGGFIWLLKSMSDRLDYIIHLLEKSDEDKDD